MFEVFSLSVDSWVGSRKVREKSISNSRASVSQKENTSTYIFLGLHICRWTLLINQRVQGSIRHLEREWVMGKWSKSNRYPSSYFNIYPKYNNSRLLSLNAFQNTGINFVVEKILDPSKIYKSYFVSVTSRESKLL